MSWFSSRFSFKVSFESHKIYRCVVVFNRKEMRCRSWYLLGNSALMRFKVSSLLLVNNLSPTLQLPLLSLPLHLSRQLLFHIKPIGYATHKLFMTLSQISHEIMSTKILQFLFHLCIKTQINVGLFKWFTS